ncbi:carbohydrate kinase family protein [Candidatus Peregrinibacteria bacterium]|nr:carbohydrate kinase family protein [Candidatus Peregrinibacteria bacterium]
METLLVTGSVAFDRIAVFKDRFKNHILQDKTHMINVAFTVDNMSVHFGGTGGNIAYNLTLLGETPYLAGAVGSDFGDYRTWLEKNGVRLDYLKELPDVLTAQAHVTTDLDDNQITAFYGGAMFRTHEARLDGLEKIHLAIIAPNGKEGMLYYADYFRKHRIPFIADPGQAIPAFNAEELLRLFKGAKVLILNDYEWSLVEQKFKIQNSKFKIFDSVEHLIVTYGEKGSKVWSRDGKIAEIPAVKPTKVVDPTGCGDAYRAGLMYGLKHWFTIERAAHVGAWIAAKAIEYPGTQNHTVDQKELKAFLQSLN